MPYLAVIIDCINETMKSRVLWVLIACWTIVLAAIAPFALDQGLTNEIQSDQILDRLTLIETLTSASENKASEAQQRIWSFIESDLQQVIVDRNKNKRGGKVPIGQLAKGLNSVLEVRELYDAKVWPTASRRTELADIATKPAESRSKESIKKLNRRLVELSFPGLIRSGNSNAIWISYAGFKIGQPLPLSKKQVRPFIESFLLVTIMRIGLGIVGVFVGIVVTSSMIPDMFQPGALHLLLSKPVSRSGLLIAKFIGATSFIAFNVCYLLLGFFFLVGARLDLWNTGILLCIPVFIFIFMIFYSVSMLAGIIWKNAIISVAVTALFWGFCTTIGITHGITSALATQLTKVVAITRVENELIATTAQGQLRMWDANKSTWQDAYGLSGGDSAVVGPFWNAKARKLMIGRPFRLPFNALQSDGIRLQIADWNENLRGDSYEAEKQPKATVEPVSITAGDEPEAEATASETKKELDSENLTESSGSAGSSDKFAEPNVDSSPAKADQDDPSTKREPLWSDKRIDAAEELPTRTRRVICQDGYILALTERGLFRSTDELFKVDDTPPISIFGFELPKAHITKSYQQLTPEDWQPRSPMDITPAFTKKGSITPALKFFVYTHGLLLTLTNDSSDTKESADMESADTESAEDRKAEVDDAKVKNQDRRKKHSAGSTIAQQQSLDLNLSEGTLALIAANSKFVVLATNKQGCFRIDADSLKSSELIDGTQKIVAKSIVVAPDGKRFIVLDRSGTLWEIDESASKVERLALERYEPINAFTIGEEGDLWFTHSIDQVCRLTASDRTIAETRVPKYTFFQQIYFRVIQPLYWLNPKPAAVGSTLRYCVSTEDPLSFGKETLELQESNEPPIEVWQPIWSNTLFICVMVSVSCLLMHRQEL